MSKYLGDRHPGCTLYDTFTTITTTGAPTSLAGSPSLLVFRDAQTCSTLGLTLAVDCNGRTGLNGWSVNTTDQSFYGCGHDYTVTLNAGTVGGTSVSGYTIATFSLNNNSSLRPMVPGCNQVATTTTGAVRINWASKDNPGASQALSCTTTFSVKSVENTVLTDSCSRVFSVQTLINTINECSRVFHVETLSNSAAGKVLDQPITEPTGVFAWASATLRNIVGWIGAVESNCVHQTATRVFMCNRAASTCIAYANVTCTDAYVMRGSFQTPA